jgi:hypothetical protein
MFSNQGQSGQHNLLSNVKTNVKGCMGEKMIIIGALKPNQYGHVMRLIT